MVIGITGGIGSGKSVVSSILENEYGFDFLSADNMAKEVMAEPLCRETLELAFGPHIFNEDGSINKTVYGNMIFSDPAMRDLSDSIIDPIIAKKIDLFIKNAYCRNASVNETENAALTEDNVKIVIETAVVYSSFKSQCDKIWYVYSDEDIRIKRLMSDRGYSYEKCKKIISSQATEEYYRNFADVVLLNNGNIDDLKVRIKNLL